jgi:superfamily II DNA or RNA helicase
MRTIRFDRGTLLLDDWPDDDVPAGFVRDPRVNLHRGPAHRYADVVLDLHRRQVPYQDDARAYAVLDRPHRRDREPRHYQREAVESWKKSGRKGVIVLPTGAGKSFVAELCIADAGRSALVVAPTLDLVSQWYDTLRRAFGEPIGVLGGGSHEILDLTVATYDSAWAHVERFGHRFGLVVFDEVHHLPSASYGIAAEASIAPFRLGLTATLERPDRAHERLPGLVGPVVYRKEITDLEGVFLAPYRTERITVHLTDADRAAYVEARAVFRDFVDGSGTSASEAPTGGTSSCGPPGGAPRVAAAHRAWRESRRLLEVAPSKLETLDALLRKHRDGRVLIFTNDNATVYQLSRTFLVPAITHHTEVKERRRLLDAFTR